MKRNCVFLLLVGFMIVTLAGTARAIDPRDAIAAPGGTDFLSFYYARAQASNYYKDGNKLSNNATLTANQELIRYGHYWATGQNSIFHASVYGGIGDANLNGFLTNNVNQGASGLADTTLNLAWWPWADWQNKLYLAVAGYVTAPTGDYDNKRVVNIGSNIWTGRFEAGGVKGWGNFYLQVVGDWYFYGDNTKYGPTGLTLQKDYLYGFEVHPSYNITKNFWVALSGYYTNGGQTRIQQTGKYNNDSQNDWNIGLGFNFNINPQTSIFLSSKYKAQTNNGLDTAEVLRLKLTYVW